MNTAPRIAECMGCGCTDDCTCEDGCHWLRVDYDAGVGVCSMCPELIDLFDAGEREPYDPDAPAHPLPNDFDDGGLILPGDPEYGETLLEMRNRRAV